MSAESGTALVRFSGLLLAALPEELDDQAGLSLHDEVACELGRQPARAVIIDVSLVTIIDSFVARVIGEVASIARLLGAEVALVGMRPEVAITLVELGITLPDVRCARSVDDALSALGASA